jgi:hypothetical protein
MQSVFSTILMFFLEKLDAELGSPTHALLSKVFSKTKKFLAIVFTAAVTAIILGSGIVLTAHEYASQYDTSGRVTFTATLITGIALILVSIPLLIFVFSKKVWQSNFHGEGMFAALRESTEKQKSKDDSGIPSLDQALSLLLIDYIEERKQKRVNTSPMGTGPELVRNESMQPAMG